MYTILKLIINKIVTFIMIVAINFATSLQVKLIIKYILMMYVSRSIELYSLFWGWCQSLFELHHLHMSLFFFAWSTSIEIAIALQHLYKVKLIIKYILMMYVSCAIELYSLFWGRCQSLFEFHHLSMSIINLSFLLFASRKEKWINHLSPN